MESRDRPWKINYELKSKTENNKSLHNLSEVILRHLEKVIKQKSKKPVTKRDPRPAS